MNANNYLNGIYSAFDSLNSKFSSGSRLVDSFPSDFYFIKQIEKTKKARLLIFANLMILFLMLYLTLNQSLSFQMLASRIILPLLLHISICILSRRLYIM